MHFHDTKLTGVGHKPRYNNWSYKNHYINILGGEGLKFLGWDDCNGKKILDFDKYYYFLDFFRIWKDIYGIIPVCLWTR